MVEMGTSDVTITEVSTKLQPLGELLRWREVTEPGRWGTGEEEPPARRLHQKTATKRIEVSRGRQAAGNWNTGHTNLPNTSLGRIIME